MWLNKETIRPADVPIRNTELWKLDGKGTVSLLSDSEFEIRFATLNGFASEIWLLCDGSNSVEDIVNELAQRRDVAAQDVSQTVIDFLKDLRRQWYTLWREELEELDSVLERR